MKNHVVSLELAREMKALGFPQDSLFFWDSHAIDKVDGYDDYMFGITSDGEYSAYLASELEEWLPKERHGFSGNYNGQIRNVDENDESECFELTFKYCYVFPKEWDIFYASFISNIRLDQTHSDKNLVEAMAKMLIRLAEKNIINPKEL